MKKLIKKRFEESISIKNKILEDMITIEKITNSVELLCRSIENGGKILIAGNGGSAADSQHIAGELVGKFLRQRRALPAVALTTDTSIITSLSNDISYNEVFTRQIDALGNTGDVFLAISTSGNSKNIINACKLAKKRNIKIIGLTGETGGLLKKIADILISVPSKCTPRIQESHLVIYHIMCELVEQYFSNNERN